MSAKIDLTGKRFGRLTVLKEIPYRKGRSIVWECKCDCGNVVQTTSEMLKRGFKQSCGCLNAEVSRKKIQENSYQPTYNHDQADVDHILNFKTRQDNKSGTKGVSFIKSKGMWKAQIGYAQKNYHILYSKNKELCIKARQTAEEIISSGGDFLNWLDEFRREHKGA